MTQELQQLVRDTMELTGSAPPALLDDAAPVLSDAALNAAGFYLVGLIGGKEVGKSSLVNALIGQDVTAVTSYGPGTETVIGYVHHSRHDELVRLLDREVPGQYRLVGHDVDALLDQVLLDLPDIDSHWAGHIEITRRMLRHMLFPVWVQSVEKYADRQPQQLLAKVAHGNSADNFVFVLNKVDQLQSAEAIEELRADFARRLGKTLGIDPPRVWMVSAANPLEFDLPALRQLLSRQKGDEAVMQSRQMALRQQERSLGGWLDSQDLAGRAQRLTRLREEAEELLSARVGVPLLERAIPALADDPANRMALTDEVLSARVARWPVVNLVHAALSPVLAVVRRNIGATRTASLPDAEALVDACLVVNGQSLAALVRSAFAQLQQEHSQVSQIMQSRRLWQDMPADLAAASLRSTLADTVQRQRETVRKKLTGKHSAITAPLRWLLTIGAVLWFPFIQPFAQFVIDHPDWRVMDLPPVVVRVFGVNQLLQNLTFLLMYFFVLWMILRWDTQRRVIRLGTRWKAESSDLSLNGQSLAWMDDLLAPIRDASEQVKSLHTRAEKFRDK